MDLDVYSSSKKKIMSLKKSAITGFKWSSISQVGKQLIQLITSIFIARLLSPSDFGLIGMANIIIGFVGIFQDLGTASAIIQQKKLSDKLLYSIFWLNTGLGIVVTIILILIAPLIGLFYNQPTVTLLVRVLAISFLLSSLSIIQKSLLERSLKFNTIAKIEISASFIGAVVGISLAIYGAKVWALVAQTLSIVIVTTFFLWIATRWHPKFLFSWLEIKSVRDYSLNIAGFNIFNYFIRNADYLLIGRFLGADALGYYTLAYRIMLYPIQNIAWSILRVSFPIFSQMQDDNARFRYAYLRVIQMIALVTFPLMIGLWGLAEPFVLTVFKSQWSPVISLILILAPVGLWQSIGTTVGTIYQAKDRTDWMFKWGIFSGIIVVLSFVIGLQWGINGVAIFYALATSLILAYPSLYIPFKLIDLSMLRFLESLWRPFVCSMIMLIAIMIVKFFLQGLSSALILGILIPVGTIVYLLSSWFINRQQILELRNLIYNQQKISP